MANCLWRVWILAIKVKVTRLDIVDTDLPGVFILDTIFKTVLFFTPPLFLGLELLDTHRLCLVIRLYTIGIRMLVEPDILGRATFGKEEQVCFDTCIGIKNPVG